MAHSRHGDHRQIELAHVTHRLKRLRVVLRRNLHRTIAINVNHAGQRHPGKRRQNARMMFAEMADADDYGLHRLPPSMPSVARPTTAMSASFADATNASRSKISVLPAS